MFQNLIEKAYADPTSAPVAGAVSIAGNYKVLLQSIITNIVNPVITLMVAIAVIYFLWGVFQFIRNAESPDERKKGGMNMLWGVVGLFLMASAYGVINLIIGTIRPL